jgi:glycogen operon protein
VTWPGGNVRALLATLFFARGTPMLTAGDEFGRSQGGNNNAYAQDNGTTWLDWEGADQALIDCAARLVAIRASHPLLTEDRFLNGDGDATWFGADGAPPDWHSPDLRFLGLVLSGESESLALAFNGGKKSLALPLAGGTLRWRRVFTSGSGGECPPHAVSLFAAIST